MTDTKELKPKSFRIDDETAEKFNAIANTIGGNQQETLAKLIEAFEFQSGKAVLTEKKSDIDQFEKYVTAITRMFMGSLEDNQNATEIARTEFDALLKSKDAIIQDLQEKLTVAKQTEAEAIAKSKEYSDENIKLRSAIDEYNTKIKNMEKSLKDKTDLNQVLTEKCKNLESKINNLQEMAQQTLKLQEEQRQSKKQCEELSRKLEQLESQSQIKLDKALFEAEKKHQEEMKQLQEIKKTEIDMYQQKYFDLLQQMQPLNLQSSLDK